MPANGFTNALNATQCSNRCRVTVVCTARTEQTVARQFRKAVASKVGVAVDFLIINTASLSKKVLPNNRAGNDASLYAFPAVWSKKL